MPGEGPRNDGKYRWPDGSFREVAYLLPGNHYHAGWILVGETSQNSLLVRGGRDPIAIPVCHNNSEHLKQLIADANAGVHARATESAKS